MLDLDTIKFTSDTSELDTAAKKIESLGTAISALSVDLAKLDKASTTAAKSQKTIANAAEDAAKAEEQLSKAKTSTVSSTDAATRAVEKQTLAMKIFRGEAVDLNDQVLTLGSSFTKGQSGQLANLKLLGATNDQLKVLAGSFEDFNKITSSNTFDNSAAGLGKLSKEIFELKKVNDLMQRGVALTRDEIVNLVRDSERLTQQFKSEGLSAQQTVQALGGLEAQTIKLAKEKNELIARTRASELAAKSEASVLEKAAIDSAKANDFLAREMSRVDNVLTGFNSNLNVTSSNRLLKFREQLKLSGVDAVTAANMLKTYEDRLKTINATNQSASKNKREDELKYLARATSVQLGDIGISLAGGQNPLLVLIQQGDQLRGVLNQVGASGNEMQKALSMAFGQIVNGSKDVVMALGSFVVGAFVDSGKAITDFALKATGVGNSLEIVRYQLTLLRNEGSKTADVLLKVFSKAPALIGGALGLLIAGVAAYAVALLQVTNANDKLSTSLIATGAQLGFTTEYAQGLASSLSGIGASRVDILNAFTEISNSGKITSESFLKVAEAALVLQSVGGPAVKETTELFGKLKEDSVETLIKYAEQTGLVTVAQIEWVKSLVESKGQAAAAEVATDLLSKAILQQAADTYSSLSSMGKLWVNIKTFTNDAWGAMQNFSASGAVMTPVVRVLETVLLTLTNVALIFTSLIRLPIAMATATISAASAIKDFVTGTLSAKDALSSVKNTVISIVDVEKERIAGYKDLTDKIKSEGKYSGENAKSALESSAKLNQENSLGATQLRKEFELQKKLKEELEKLDTKNLTKQQFMNKAVESYGKIVGGTAKINAENLKNIEKIAAAEWDKANKPKKEKKKEKSEEEVEAEKALSWYMKTLERVDDLKNKTIGLVKELTKAEVLLMDLSDDSYFKQMSPQKQIKMVDSLYEVAEIERALVLQKEQVRVQKEIGKVREDNDKFLGKEKEDQTKILQDSTMKLALLGKTADEQFVITEQHDLQNKLLATNLRFEAQRLKLKSDYAKLDNKDGFDSHVLEFELDKIAQQEAETRDALTQNSANKFQIAYTEKILKVGAVLSDAITTALFEGGQAGTKKLKDYIVGIFREKINIQINAVVNQGLNTLLGGSSSGSSAGGGTGSLSSLSSLYSMGKSGLSTVGGWLGMGGGAAAGSAQATSLGFSTAFGSAPTAAGTGVGAMGGMKAALASIPVVGWIMMGMMASGDAYDKGFRADNSAAADGTRFEVSDGGVLGTTASFADRMLQGLGLDGKTAGILSGSTLSKQVVYSLLGGYKISPAGGGISGTLSTTGASAQARTDYTQDHRGFLGIGSYTTKNSSYSKLDGGMQAVLDGGVKATTIAVQEYAKAIGLSADAVTGFTKEINIDLTGLDEEAVQKKLLETFSGFGDEMAKTAYGSALEGLSKSGETSTQTLERLASSLGVVNADLEQLGIELLPISATSASIASGLVDAFGGVEAMQSTVTEYYNIMYSEAERAAKATDNVTKQFKALGVEMPQSVAGFRNLVSGIDSTTSSGQKLIASLMELAPAFDQVSQNAQQAAADMLNALQNYGTPEEVRQFEIGNVVSALANAGLTLTQDQITNATVASVRELYLQLKSNESTEGQAYALMQQQQAIFALISARDNGSNNDGYGSNGLMPGSSSGSTGGGSSISEQASVIDKTIQATLDYNQAMLEATGTTEEIAAAQRALADAAKLAAGWTQVQIDTLNRALDLKINLDNLEQARQSVIGLFKQIEDNAKNTQAAVDSAKQSITQGYLSAVDRQKQAQENVNALIRQAAEEMRGFSNGIKEFLVEVGGSDLGTNSKLEQLSVLQAQFDAIADLARGGDRKAFGEVTDKARGLLTAGKGQFATAEEFARFSANIGNTLTELSTIAEAQAGPITAAIDPMVAAQQELALATADVVKWSEAISISGAATSLAATDYLAEWRIAEAANVIAQQELREAQLLTKDVNMQLLTVLQQLVAAMGMFNAANAKTPVYGGNVPMNTTGSIYAGMGSDVKTIQDLYSVNLGREGDIAGMDYWAKKFLEDGVIDAAERQEFAIASIPEYQAKFPSFDVGINEVPYDMTAQLHKGERIMPAADNRELMARLSSPNLQQDNTELSTVVQELHQRLIMIESNTASTAVHSAKTARLLDRAMPDGDAVATREAAAL